MELHETRWSNSLEANQSLPWCKDSHADGTSAGQDSRDGMVDDK